MREAARSAVARLNAATGASFRPDSAKTLSLVSARMAEGYTAADLAAVVDRKAEGWLGTEMSRFLRPETLFGPKFEGYLNERPRGRPRGRPGEYGIEGDDPFRCPNPVVVGGGAT